jgi:hypothetical protein
VKQASAARLKRLWEQAPYYTDPAHIAPKLGLTVPPSYEELKESDPERAEKIRQEAQQAAEKAEERAHFRAERGERAYFFKYNLGTRPGQVFVSTVCLLFGVGSYTGIIAESWVAGESVRQIPGCVACSGTLLGPSVLWGVGAALLAGILFYWMALRKVHSGRVLALALLVSGALVFLVTALAVPHFIIGAATREALQNQFLVGWAIGLTVGMLVFAACSPTFRDSMPDRWVFFVVALAGFFGLVLWLILAGIGTIANWDLRFGYGWDASLFGGLLLMLITYAGLAALLIIGIPSAQRHYPEDK